MTDATVTVCPECRNTRISPCQPQAPTGTAGHDWRCRTCAAHFETPAERPAEAATTPTGLAGELLAADPSEVPAND